MTNENQGGDYAAAYEHLKKRLSQPGAFRMDDEQRLHTLLSALSPSEQPEPVAWTSQTDLDFMKGGSFRSEMMWCWSDTHHAIPLYAQPSEQTGGGGKAACRIAELEFELSAKAHTVEICEEQITRLERRLAALGGSQ